MNKLSTVLCVLSLLAGPSGAFAADPVKDYLQHRFSGEAVEVKDVTGLSQRISDGKLHLNLKDFLALVLKNAADIQVTRLDVYTAADQITNAKAPFDPAIQLNFNALHSVFPLGYAIGGPFASGGGTGTGSGSLGQINLPQTINSLSQRSSIDYKQLLPTGQQITADFTGDRSSGDSYLYPSLFGSLNFQITQPLLQNRTNLQYRAPLKIARTELLITSETSEAAIADSLALAAREYWQAVLSRDNIRVQQQALDLARKSYDHDKQALDLGALAKLDIYQSETQVAERNRDLIQAQYQYKAALDSLRRLIGADLTPAFRSTEIVLDDDPTAVPSKEAILPFEDALAKAMQVRPEAKAAEQRVSVDELNARVARDSLLPRLDLSLQGGATGPGLNQIVPGGVVGVAPSMPYPGLGQTLQQVMEFNYPSYGLGLQLTFPLRNSPAQAALADSLVSRAKDRYQQRRVKEQIILDVRQALTSIELADASIQAAIRARDLAQQNVLAEQQKYQLGSITSFELLDSQSRLASTESALLSAYVGFQEAYIGYERATWTLLDGMGMILERPHVR